MDDTPISVKWKVRVPAEWYVEEYDDIIIKPPKHTGLTRKAMPEIDAEEEDEWLIFYFYFENELEALQFKLTYC